MLLASLNNFQRSALVSFKYFWWLILLVGFIRNPLVLLLWSLVIQFIFLLSARPSIEIKNISYFVKYTPYIWGCFLLETLFPPFNNIASFFFLDSKNNGSSFASAAKNGFLLFIYFLPVTLTFSAMLIFIIPNLCMFLPMPFGIIIALLFNLFFASFLSIYYTKIKHGNYHLFFNNQP
jgi:hypothetical protein